MKIAMSSPDLPNESKGGATFQVHYLANALVERGHEVTIFTFSPADDTCLYQVRQYRRPPQQLRRFQSFILAGYLATTNFSEFELVHTHGDNYLMWNIHPQVRTFHGSGKDEAKSAVTLRRRIYQTVIAELETAGSWVADISVGVSKTTQDRIPKISTIIPCGVDLRHFYPGVKTAHPTLLFVGTLEGRKRGRLLVEIFLEQVRSLFPDAELWMVAEQAIAAESIVNFGKIPLAQICELYRQAWVFCLPSTYEGFGVPYIEAMASGTPAVATPNPGALEVLDQGKYGVISSDANLGQAIINLFQDQNLRQQYIDLGQTRSLEFSWDRIAAQYEAIYAKLIK